MICDWTIFAFPLNFLLALIWTCGWIWLWKKRRSCLVMRFMHSPKATLSSLLLMLGSCIWIGFTGNRDFTQSIFFIIILLYIQTVLLLVILRGWRTARGNIRWRFILLHAGLLLALGSGFWGAPDSSQMRVRLMSDQTTREAYFIDGTRGVLSYELTLKEFEAEYSPNHKPVHYEAVITVDNKEPVKITVNHPYNVRAGENIYLTEVSEYGCVFQIVREPWRVFALVGILMLIAGAFMLFIKGPRR